MFSKDGYIFDLEVRHNVELLISNDFILIWEVLGIPQKYQKIRCLRNCSGFDTRTVDILIMRLHSKQNEQTNIRKCYGISVSQMTTDMFRLS
jgi:hypothetical protein